MVTYRLTEGLGDCLIAAACCEELSKRTGQRVGFKTSPLIAPFLGRNECLDLNSTEEPVQLKWVSQMNDPGAYSLHTSQRFSTQMGFMIDPTKVVNLYNPHNQVVVASNTALRHSPKGNFICINKASKEKGRRYLSDRVCEVIEEFAKTMGLGTAYLGDGGCTDITQCVCHLEDCKFFVGPVSFMYHLASALRVPSVLLTGYMPDYKFSHFFNTVSLRSRKWCTAECEVNEKSIRRIVGCDRENTCYAQDDYPDAEIVRCLETAYHLKIECD